MTELDGLLDEEFVFDCKNLLAEFVLPVVAVFAVELATEVFARVIPDVEDVPLVEAKLINTPVSAPEPGNLNATGTICNNFPGCPYRAQCRIWCPLSRE